MVSSPQILQLLGQFFSQIGGAPGRVLNTALGFVWNTLLVGGGITLAKLYFPEVWRAGLQLLGGKEAADHYAAKIAERSREMGQNDVGDVIMDSAKEAGMIGAATTAAQQVFRNDISGLIAGAGVAVLLAQAYRASPSAGAADAVAGGTPPTPPTASKGAGLAVN